MRVFTIAGATRYCTNFRPDPNVAGLSLTDFVDNNLGNIRQLPEGSVQFDQYRTCALRDAERYLFLASSHYRRALDLMISTSSHWAQVTLYYGAWFAAHAILNMFGCAIFAKQIVEVDRDAAGTQRLRMRRIGRGGNQYRFTLNGSHRRFWEAFYATTPSIVRFADPRYSATLSPISNDIEWLIKQRNRINYKPIESISCVDLFANSFSRLSFPSSLPGELNTQYRVCEGLLAVGCTFAQQLGLHTDALDSFGAALSFQEKVAQEIYDPKPPNLVANTVSNQIFGLQISSPLLA